MYNVGTVKYLVNYYDGVQTHKDGSPFYKIETFKNKKKMNAFIKKLKNAGYVYR
jgi:hypothetical protein